MVWIYGGGFATGNSSYQIYGPDYLLDEDNIVFVSFNYRLGAFGFLSTEDLACPGNMGLKDQVLALKWVKRNIEHFGGDPNKVTIFGESAGSASVSYQLQSRSSKGNNTSGLFMPYSISKVVVCRTISKYHHAKNVHLKINHIKTRNFYQHDWSYSPGRPLGSFSILFRLLQAPIFPVC